MCIIFFFFWDDYVVMCVQFPLLPVKRIVKKNRRYD